jgi:hypothetical protein
VTGLSVVTEFVPNLSEQSGNRAQAVRAASSGGADGRIRYAPETRISTLLLSYKIKVWTEYLAG